MKTNSIQSTRLFQDRPIQETPRRCRSLDLSGMDHTDFADSALRVFLVVCLVASLTVSGWQWSAPTTDAGARTADAPSTLAGTICHPALAPLAHKVSAAVSSFR